MRERPEGAELLELAGSELRATLLPLLPAEHRHTALMIGNAMAIAARQLHAGETPLRRECAKAIPPGSIPTDVLSRAGQGQEMLQ